MSSDFFPDVEKRFNRPLGRGAEISSGRSSPSCEIARIQLSRQKSVAEPKIQLREKSRVVLFTYFRSQIPRIYLLIPEANINELHMAVACPHGRPKIGEMALELALFNTFPTVYHKPWLGYIYIVVLPAQRYIGYRLRLL